jgi:hypothetical protein
MNETLNSADLGGSAATQALTQRSPPHCVDPGDCKNATLALPPFFLSTMTEYDDYGVPVGAYQEPDSFTGQTYRTARAFFLYRVKPFVESRVTQGRWKRLFSLANALVVTWWFVVYWGERGAFNSAVGSCNWDAWENWVCQGSSAPAHRTDFDPGGRSKPSQTRLRRRSPAR